MLGLVPFSGFIEKDKDERSLNLVITRTEKSKDSYSSTETISLRENVLRYSKSFSGKLKSKPAVNKSMRLTQEETGEVFLKFKQSGLYLNVTSPKRNEFKIPYSSLSADLVIFAQANERYEIQLYDIASELQKTEEYKKIEMLQAWLLLKFPK